MMDQGFFLKNNKKVQYVVAGWDSLVFSGLANLQIFWSKSLQKWFVCRTSVVRAELFTERANREDLKTVQHLKKSESGIGAQNKSREILSWKAQQYTWMTAIHESSPLAYRVTTHRARFSDNFFCPFHQSCNCRQRWQHPLPKCHKGYGRRPLKSALSPRARRAPWSGSASVVR